MCDSVRWFILSDSPPEKDVQWSDKGVISSNKFLQKIWNLNQNIISRKEKNGDKELETKFNSLIDNLSYNINKSIEEFKFNVSIAYFHEAYNAFNKYINKDLSNTCLLDSLIQIMKLMTPFTPHLANECLELLKCEDVEKWPEIKENLNEEINFAVQVNGKTRDIITIKKDAAQKKVEDIIKNQSKAKKFVENKEIIKIIFVKNKIINYIVK